MLKKHSQNWIDRNGRQAICASLIATTMVSTDCTDDDCLCASPLDSEDPYAALEEAGPASAENVELPLEGKVVFSLAPVVTPLKSDEFFNGDPLAIAAKVAELPGQVIIEELRVDAISHADYATSLSDEDEKAPRLTTRRRGAAANGNSAKTIESTAGSEEIAVLEEVLELVVDEVPATAPPKPAEKPKQALMQDSYIAFGVNAY